LGLPTRVLEANPGDAYSPVTRVRVWLTDDGVRLRTDQWLRNSTGDPQVQFTVDEVQTGVGEPSLNLRTRYSGLDASNVAPVDFLGAYTFDPVAGASRSLPEMSSLLYPVRSPIVAGFDLTGSEFLTGTWESGILQTSGLSDLGVLGERYWWVTESFDRSGSGVLVIQGPESQTIPPVNLLEAWPPAWPAQRPPVDLGPLDWAYSAHTSGAFEDSTEYQYWEVRWGGALLAEPWKVRPDALLTWTESDRVRVVVLGTGVQGQELLAFAAELRSASSPKALGRVPGPGPRAGTRS
jgi:hypothetical protein